MMDLQHTINLTLGDWSHDGHGWTENYTIKSNLTHKEIEQALAKGQELTGVTLDNIAAEHEEPYIDYEDWVKLNAHGLTVERLCASTVYDKDWITGGTNNDISKKGPIRIHEESFLNIFYFLVEKGNPDFTYRILEDDAPVLRLGGYGLFTS